MVQGRELGAVTIACGRRRWLRLGDTITVRNFFRTYRIDWDEVHWFRDGLFIGYWVLEIVLRDGRLIDALGTSDQKTACPETLAAIRQAAERHAVPAVLIGTTDAVHRGKPDAVGLYLDPGGKLGLRQWTGTVWSPYLQVDPASSGPEGELGPGTVWSSLPEAEQRRGRPGRGRPGQYLTRPPPGPGPCRCSPGQSLTSRRPANCSVLL